MTVSLRDARTNLRDREWIESVYRDYLDDLGLLNTGIFPALGEIGHREPDQLQRWLVDRSATLLTILDDQQPTDLQWWRAKRWRRGRRISAWQNYSWHATTGDAAWGAAQCA